MQMWKLFPLTLAAIGLIGCQEGTLDVNSGDENPDFSEHGEEFEKVGTSAGQIDPARVTLRRLNRTEYNNTVRDLLGVSERTITRMVARGEIIREEGAGRENL